MYVYNERMVEQKNDGSLTNANIALREVETFGTPYMKKNFINETELGTTRSFIRISFAKRAKQEGREKKTMERIS